MPQFPTAPLDEDDARRVLLARAVESASDGALLPAAERSRIDRNARDELLREAAGRPVDPRRLLRLRADQVIAAVGVREPGLVALLAPSPWPGRIAWLLPLLALVLGAASDWVGDPHRVNLLSIPLAGLLAWNLVVYGVLLASLLRGKGRHSPWLAGLAGWTDGERALRRGGPARLQARLLFQRDWLKASRAAETARWTRVLHLCAACWALGWLASLAVRGLVVEYRVGWESTFLGPAQVHAVLAALRGPAAWLQALPPLSMEEVAALHFGAGGGTATGGRAWVLMVAVLLAAVVVLPRLLLAAVAAVSQARARRRPGVSLDDPYFARILSLLDTGRVALAVLETRDEDLDWLRRRFAQDARAWPLLGSSDQGDELRLLLGAPPAPAAVPARGSAWWPWRGPVAAPASAAAQAQGALCVVRSPQALAQARDAAQAAGGLPLLALWRGEVPGPASQPGCTVLREDEAGACWVQRTRLHQALAGLLPTPQAEAVRRVGEALAASDAQRLQQAMHAAALYLLSAARQQEELHGLASGASRLLPGPRREAAQAQERAMDGILGRVREAGQRYLDRLRELHAVPEGEMALAEQQLEARFQVDSPVHAPQAGMAGAATGAAVGATVDLAAGGLTLGAAAALGALVGGGAAYVGALWKNRATPGGGTLVQLSEDMLQALAEAALMQYLAVVHAPAATDLAWPGWVTQALAQRRPQMAPFWAQARTQPDAHRLAQPLGHVLEGAMRELLARAWPEGILSS
ncbi:MULTISPECIES: DUF3482 domain-containing protein [Ramlibacter]|uniref:DUF3482 domain-containing protein n=1 Tax=Ramlibacter aquaticus TaxID=2780094 RepID=A0ABR9SJJ9_9BURK|nr:MULTISPECIES: DUF3482 domain-containing protein [Ramlibacter]MBE7942538.1 DUF3482 domain-containing protein [Ramlibacter aquaticus]